MAATRLDRAMRALSRSANKGRLWFALAAVGALVPGPTRRAVIRGAGALAATSLITNAFLKPVTGRQRPAVELTPVFRRLHRPPRTTSFPSGHAASASAFATGVAMESPVLGAVIAPLAAGVAYSRVHVGVHHVSDVVAGAALGAGIAMATRRWWPVRPSVPARVRENAAAPPITDGEGLVLVVNQRSGPDDGSSDLLRELLPAADFLELNPDTDLDEELDRRAGQARALGAAGGDGTIASVAAAALRHRLPLAVFPAGTLNHFAREVGLETLDDTLRALRDGDAVTVDVAEVNGVPFLNTAVLGAYPEMVRRRDQLKPTVGKWLGMAVATGQVLHRHEPLRLLLDGEPIEAWTLFVGNGAYHWQGAAPAWRPRLDDGWLDVQYLRADTPLSRTRVALSALAGLTERNGVHHTRLATELRVESRSGPVRIACDGEPGENATSFRFAKLPGTLVIYRSL